MLLLRLSLLRRLLFLFPHALGARRITTCCVVTLLRPPETVDAWRLSLASAAEAVTSAAAGPATTTTLDSGSPTTAVADGSEAMELPRAVRGVISTAVADARLATAAAAAAFFLLLLLSLLTKDGLAAAAAK